VCNSKISCTFANPPQKKHPKAKNGNPIEISRFVFGWLSLAIGQQAVLGIKKQMFRFQIVTHSGWCKIRQFDVIRWLVIALFVCILHCSNNSQSK
jgi:hypothetical protein